MSPNILVLTWTNMDFFYLLTATSYLKLCVDILCTQYTRRQDDLLTDFKLQPPNSYNETYVHMSMKYIIDRKKNKGEIK